MSGGTGKLALTVRNRRFGRGQAQPSRWAMGGDPYATAFYNAMSAAITRGESFFIETLRQYKDAVPPPISGEIAAFIMQEAIHAREHDALNRRIAKARYDLAPLQAQVDRRLAPIRAKPLVVSLAATMGLEHFTAVLAHELLSDPRHLSIADDETRALWRWHAIEEIEHKAVAFDTFDHVTRDWTRGRRWRVRTKVMLLVTRNFMLDRYRGMKELLRQDGLSGRRVTARLLWFCLVHPGMIRKMWQGWFAYLLPGFHPWQQDDAYLVKAYLAEEAKLAEPSQARTPPPRAELAA